MQRARRPQPPNAPKRTTDKIGVKIVSSSLPSEMQTVAEDDNQVNPWPNDGTVQARAPANGRAVAASAAAMQRRAQQVQKEDLDRVANLQKRETRAAEAQRLKAIAETDMHQRTIETLRKRREQVKQRREAMDAERLERCAHAITGKSVPKTSEYRTVADDGAAAAVLLVAGDIKAEVAATATTHKTSAVMSRVYVQAVGTVGTRCYSPTSFSISSSGPRKECGHSGNAQLQPSPPLAPRSTETDCTQTNAPMKRPMSANVSLSSKNAAIYAVREDNDSSRLRPRTAPAHGRAAYCRATEEEADAAKEAHAGNLGVPLRTIEDQWKKYEQTVALKNQRQQRQRHLQQQRQQRRRHPSSAQTDRRHYGTEWAAHARTIRSRPVSATSRVSEIMPTETQASGVPSSFYRHRHCQLAIDCTPTMHGPRHFPSRTPGKMAGKAWVTPPAKVAIEGLHLQQHAEEPSTMQTPAPSQGRFASCIAVVDCGHNQEGVTKVRSEIPQWNRNIRQWVEASSGVEKH